MLDLRALQGLGQAVWSSFVFFHLFWRMLQRRLAVKLQKPRRLTQCKAEQIMIEFSVFGVNFPLKIHESCLKLSSEPTVTSSELSVPPCSLLV